VGTPKGEGQPVNVDDIMVEIGGTITVAEFSDNLRGAKIGEVREFEVTYPEDFQDKRLAGKTVAYAVTIKGIKKKALPELNDDFAKGLGEEFTSLDDLRTRIRLDAGEVARCHFGGEDLASRRIDALADDDEGPVEADDDLLGGGTDNGVGHVAVL